MAPEADARILVVDDDEALARMLKVLLVSEGYNVQVANNGQQALECLERADASLILLDLQMPVMDGRTFFRELRGRGDTTPVIILSAYNADGARQELGAEAALNKPADPNVIGNTIRQLLEESQAKAS